MSRRNVAVALLLSIGLVGLYVMTSYHGASRQDDQELRDALALWERVTGAIDLADTSREPADDQTSAAYAYLAAADVVNPMRSEIIVLRREWDTLSAEERRVRIGQVPQTFYEHVKTAESRRFTGWPKTREQYEHEMFETYSGTFLPADATPVSSSVEVVIMTLSLLAMDAIEQDEPVKAFEYLSSGLVLNGRQATSPGVSSYLLFIRNEKLLLRTCKSIIESGAVPPDRVILPLRQRAYRDLARKCLVSDGRMFIQLYEERRLTDVLGSEGVVARRLNIKPPSTTGERSPHRLLMYVLLTYARSIERDASTVPLSDGPLDASEDWERAPFASAVRDYSWLVWQQAELLEWKRRAVLGE